MCPSGNNSRLNHLVGKILRRLPNSNTSSPSPPYWTDVCFLYDQLCLIVGGTCEYNGPVTPLIMLRYIKLRLCRLVAEIQSKRSAVLLTLKKQTATL